MTAKTLVLWVVGLALTLGFGALADRACVQLPARLAEAKVEYQVLLASAELANSAAQAEREALHAIISEREASEAALKEKVAQSAKELVLAKATIAELQANEPPTTPEVEALPVVISLRAQVRQFSLALAVAERTIDDQRAIIFSLELDKKDLLAVANSWKAQYEREHVLRLASEDLFKLSERRFKLNNVVTKVVVGAAVAGTVFYLTRK